MKASIALLLACLPCVAQAHRPSDAFLTLAVHDAQVSGHWEIALRDLAVAVAIDGDRDRVLTWGELRAARPRLEAAVAGALHVSADGRACPLRLTDLMVNDRSEGRFAWIGLVAACPAPPAVLTLDYGLLFAIDPNHRGLLALQAGAQAHAGIFSPGTPRLDFTVGAPSRLREFGLYLREGTHHVWIGIDHVLFLLALLLPSVLRREPAGWRGVERLAPALRDVAAIVTAFTLAHSVTLGLSALDVVRVPSSPVEAAIALSVVLAALNNLRPIVTRRRWAAAFGFGLLHGFGFATALGELGLPDGARVLALIAFNLGIELGQLAIVAVTVPLAFALRETALYRRGLVTGGSCLVAGVAAAWLAQRALGS